MAHPLTNQVYIHASCPLNYKKKKYIKSTNMYKQEQIKQSNQVSFPRKDTKNITKLGKIHTFFKLKKGHIK